jgi:hypothetical protein
VAAYRSPGTRDLGPVSSRHFPRRWKWWGWLFAGIMFVSQAFAAVGANFAKDIDSRDRYIVAAVAGVAVLVIVGAILLNLRRRNDEVRLHERGCVLRWNGAETAFLWGDVVACCTRPPALPDTSRNRNFELVLRDGSHLTVPPPEGFFFDHVSATSFEAPMREAIARALVRSVRAAYEKGEPVAFSKIEAHAERGLSCGGQVLRWSEIAEVDWESEYDIVQIYRRPRVKWAAVGPRSTPNLDLLLLLVARRGALPPE